jgi:hypothetical protein
MKAAVYTDTRAVWLDSSRRITYEESMSVLPTVLDIVDRYGFGFDDRLWERSCGYICIVQPKGGDNDSGGWIYRIDLPSLHHSPAYYSAKRDAAPIVLRELFLVLAAKIPCICIIPEDVYKAFLYEPEYILTVGPFEMWSRAVSNVNLNYKLNYEINFKDAGNKVRFCLTESGRSVLGEDLVKSAEPRRRIRPLCAAY